jgi:hypothetical protein
LEIRIEKDSHSLFTVAGFEKKKKLSEKRKKRIKNCKRKENKEDIQTGKENRHSEKKRLLKQCIRKRPTVL